MKTGKIVRLVLLLLLGWVSMDLFIPIKSDIRHFNPPVVARLDTEMWRSYYDRRPGKLFLQLASLLRRQFHAPFWRSNLIAFHAAKAAFVFKKGKTRVDYEQALPSLTHYYQALHRMSTTDFEVKEAARLELEWWIVHRQRAQHQRGDLEKALAESAAVIYKIAPEQLIDYARYRAAAMDIRDREQERDGISEAEWARIADLLQLCWQSLYEQVNKK